MIENKPKPCPHCGSTAGIYRNCRAFGIVEEQQWVQKHEALSKPTEYSVETEVDTDAVTGPMGRSGLHFTKPKTVRCLECRKIRKDVTWEGYERSGEEDD